MLNLNEMLETVSVRSPESSIFELLEMPVELITQSTLLAEAEHNGSCQGNGSCG